MDDLLKQSALAYQALMPYKYHFTLGYKNMRPGTHKIAVGGIPFSVVFLCAVHPHFIDERLQIHAIDDEPRHDFHRQQEFFQPQPRHFLVHFEIKQALQRPDAAILHDFPKVHSNFIGDLPDGTVLGVVLPCTGKGAVFATPAGYAKAMPHNPCVDIPDGFQKLIRHDHIPVLLGLSNRPKVSRHLPVIRELLEHFLGQGIEYHDPAQVVSVRDEDVASGVWNWDSRNIGSLPFCFFVTLDL